MAKRGGKRQGAGRKAGVPNKVNREIRALAGQHDELAVLTLAEIAGNAEAPAAARVSAAVALMDRAHGKPAQAVDLKGNLALDVRTKEERDAAVAAALRADG